MDLTQDVQTVIESAAALLNGSALRRFMAGVVRQLGRGGQRQAERELGWDRGTIRKGEHELRSGVECLDGRAGNERAGVEERLPSLKSDIKDVVEIWSQTDPRFKTTARYSRLTVAAVIKRLIQDKGYRDQDLPSNETIRKLIHKLGFRLRKVQKAKPKKRSRRPMPSSASSTN